MQTQDFGDPVFKKTIINGKTYTVLDVKNTIQPKIVTSTPPATPRGNADEDFEEDEVEGGGCVFTCGRWTNHVPVRSETWKKVGRNLTASEGVTFTARGDGVEVTASTREDLLYAISDLKERIELATSPTHFICIPLGDEEAFRRFKEFRDDLRGIQSTPTPLAEYLLPSVRKLHLTLCVLKLTDDEKISSALAAFEEFKDRYYGGRLSEGDLIRVPLRGLRCMQEDPCQARVLYTGEFDVNGNGDRLNALCDLLYTCFLEKGVLSREELVSQRVLDSSKKLAQVNFHATVLNDKYGRKRGEGDIGTRAMQFFDATEVVKIYGTTLDFGVAECSQLRLCELGGGSGKGDGFYKTVATLEL